MLGRAKASRNATIKKIVGGTYASTPPTRCQAPNAGFGNGRHRDGAHCGAVLNDDRFALAGIRAAQPRYDLEITVGNDSIAGTDAGAIGERTRHDALNRAHARRQREAERPLAPVFGEVGVADRQVVERDHQQRRDDEQNSREGLAHTG